MLLRRNDKENQNITLHIPQTSLNHIFQPTPKRPDMSSYNVLTKANRDFLLGYRVEGVDVDSPEAEKYKGAIDKGIDYLLNAITLVGAQNARLEMTNSNVTTELENEIGSESTIRDADMAKEMANYTKSNILFQAAQSMLAQANQNSSAVLELLQ